MSRSRLSPPLSGTFKVLEQTSLGKILEEGCGKSSADANGPFASVDVLLPI